MHTRTYIYLHESDNISSNQACTDLRIACPWFNIIRFLGVVISAKNFQVVPNIIYTLNWVSRTLDNIRNLNYFRI